jgi:thioredoxin 1
MSNVNEIESNSFQTEVLDSTLPVLVDFYAPWCGPCKMIAPMLENLAGEFEGRVKVVKVNVDNAAELAAKYQITGVPTLMIFQGGDVAETMVGAASADAIRTKLEAAAA